MPQPFKDFWAGLSETQRTMVIIAGIATAAVILFALVTNASDWATWLQQKI